MGKLVSVNDSLFCLLSCKIKDKVENRLELRLHQKLAQSPYVCVNKRKSRDLKVAGSVLHGCMSLEVIKNFKKLL